MSGEKLTPMEGVTMDDAASLVNGDIVCEEVASSATAPLGDVSPFEVGDDASTLFALFVAWRDLAELKYLPPPGLVKTE